MSVAGLYLVSPWVYCRENRMEPSVGGSESHCAPFRRQLLTLNESPSQCWAVSSFINQECLRALPACKAVIRINNKAPEINICNTLQPPCAVITPIKDERAMAQKSEVSCWWTPNYKVLGVGSEPPGLKQGKVLWLLLPGDGCSGTCLIETLSKNHPGVMGADGHWQWWLYFQATFGSSEIFEPLLVGFILYVCL